jgi:hypothetical protein
MNLSRRIFMKNSKLLSLIALVTLAGASNVAAQTTILSEGFEGYFPQDNNWTVGDDNPSGTTAYWDDVPAGFGTAGAHSGLWKGYCAGVGHGGTSQYPTYQNSMTAYMSRPLDLTGYGSATLSFWYRIPSIESNFDHCNVYVANNLVWTTTAPATNWTFVSINLDSYVGIIPILRFEFTSDSSVVYEGWYLDDILVTALPPPPNDMFANAQVLTGGSGTVTGSNVAATQEPGESPLELGTSTGTHTVWYHWTPAVSGQYFFRTGGSSFDTMLGVFTGDSLTNLTLLVANDDAEPNHASRVSAYFTAGTTYFICVDGYLTAAGNIVLNWDQDFAATVINFDGLSPGTTVSNQYHTNGVDFTVNNGNLLPTIQAAAMAESGGQVAKLNWAGEFGQPTGGGNFTSFKQHVRVFAGYLPDGSTNSAQLTLSAFDISSGVVTQVTATVTAGRGFFTLLQANSPQTNIASFQVAARVADQNKPVAIDDLSFDQTLPGLPPDFALSSAVPGLSVNQGFSVTNLITVLRFNGSTGLVQFSASGLPAGVTASFLPNPATDSASLVLSAAANATPTGGSPVPITVTGNPLSPSVGSGLRTNQILLSVRANFTVSLNPSPIDVPSCGASTGTVAVTRDIGFHGVVTLSAAGLTNLFQATFNPPSVDFHDGGLVNSSTLTVQASAVPTNRYYQFQIVGTSPSLPSATADRVVHTTLGHIDSVVPASGWAPQSLQAGTEIVIHGTGFCPGAKVQFGNLHAVVDPVSISPDGSELHVRVPRLGTDGALMVWLPDGGKMYSPSNFKVQTYRNMRGYAFLNSDAFQNLVGGYNFNDCVELFGYAQTHLLGTGIPDPLVGVFVLIANASLKSGQCFGFSLSSQRLMHGDAAYNWFPFQPNLTTPTPWNLLGPDNGDTVGASPSLTHYVHLQHLAQLSAEQVHYWLASASWNLTQASSSSIYNQVAGYLNAGDHPLIEIRDGDGHVLVGYDLEPGAGPNDYYIDVYDPNLPFITSENDALAGDHLTREQNSRVHVTADNHWSNPHNGGLWSGGFNNLVVLPYNVVPVQPKLPTSLDGFLTFVLGGSAQSAQFADTNGLTLFMPDGSINTNAATRLTNAMPFAPLSDTNSGPAGFIFATTTNEIVGMTTNDFVHTVRGTGVGAYTHSVLGHDFITRIIDINANTNTLDTVTVNSQSPVVRFQTSDPSKPLKVQLLARATNGAVHTATFWTTTFANAGDKFSYDQSSERMIFSHVGPSTAFGFTLSQADQNGNPAVFVSANLLIGAGDTAIIRPTDWQNLGTTPVTLTVTNATGQSNQTLLATIPLPLGFGPDGFHGTFRGHIGLQYTIQFSGDLTNWSSLVTVPCLDGTVPFVDSTMGLPNKRFYRAVGW